MASGNTAIGDLDGDGDPDIYAGSQVLLNDGAGNLTALPGAVPAAPPAFPCPNVFSYRNPVIADCDGDVDVLVMSDSAATLYLNDGTGRMTTALPQWTGVGVFAGASGDVDGDGLVDHVFHNGGAVVVLRRLVTGFLPPVTTTPTAVTKGLVLLELDLDGSDEVCRADADGLTASRVNAAGTLGPEFLRRHVRSRGGRVALLAGDLDDDGIDDVSRSSTGSPRRSSATARPASMSCGGTTCPRRSPSTEPWPTSTATARRTSASAGSESPRRSSSTTAPATSPPGSPWWPPSRS